MMKNVTLAMSMTPTTSTIHEGMYGNHKVFIKEDDIKVADDEGVESLVQEARGLQRIARGSGRSSVWLSCT
jgi:hypothetical protein